MVERYIASRETLRALVVVVDVRRGIADGDRLMLEFARTHSLQVLVVASKVDKLKRDARRRSLISMESEAVEVFPFSALRGDGIGAIRARLEGYARIE